VQETPEQYIQRMLGLLGGQAPLKIQAATPKKLGRLIGRASAAKLRKRPAPGKWSAAEIVAHLADCEIASSAGGCGRFSALPELPFNLLTRIHGPLRAIMRNGTRANRSNSFEWRGKRTSRF
jgi:hypothetical protein